MSFYLNFESPVSKNTLQLKELSFKQYRELNKYILNNNNNLIEDYFNKILKENLHSKHDFKVLSNFDKFCCLFMLRCVSVSSEIELIDKKTTIQTSLMKFLNTCCNFKATFNKEIISGPFKITLEIPKTFLFDTFLNLSNFLIKNVSVDNDFIDFTNISLDQKKQIVDSLPATIMNDLKQFFDLLNEEFEALKLTLPTIEEPIKLNPFDSSLIEFLKIIFKTNLNGLYEMQYLLVSKLGFTPEYTDNQTFVENIILLKLYESELKKQEEASKKSPGPGLPGKPFNGV